MITGTSQEAYDMYEAQNSNADRYAGYGNIFEDFSTMGGAEARRRQDRYQQKAADALTLGMMREQMEFQEKMDNSKIQRLVKDLQAAGFSPMALLSNVSGGSAPAGASGSYSSASKSRARDKGGLGDLAALAIRVLGLLALKK